MMNTITKEEQNKQIVETLTKFVAEGGKLTKKTLKGFGLTTRKAREAGYKIAPFPRFVLGDHFYNGLPYKRINGKFKVKR